MRGQSSCKGVQFEANIYKTQSLAIGVNNKKKKKRESKV